MINSLHHAVIKYNYDVRIVFFYHKADSNSL